MTNNYFPMILEIPKSIALFEGSQVPFLCFSDNSIIKMNISMEHWWNDAEYSERNLSRCGTSRLLVFIREAHIAYCGGPGSTLG